jgi:hypothetical protein
MYSIGTSILDANSYSLEVLEYLFSRINFAVI